MKVKLAEALLRRKELALKVQLLGNFKQYALFEVRSQRVKAHEGIDEVTANVPKLTASQVTAEHDWYSRQLRLVDAAIQNTNWTVELELDNCTMGDYSDVK